MGCGWWNPPTPYKEDCYWYREEQDMNAHIPYCACKNQFPLNTCENCDNYHSRNRRTQGDRIRGMTDDELAIEMTAKGGCPHDCEEPENMDTDCVKCWLDWLKEEVTDG